MLSRRTRLATLGFAFIAAGCSTPTNGSGPPVPLDASMVPDGAADAAGDTSVLPDVRPADVTVADVSPLDAPADVAPPEDARDDALDAATDADADADADSSVVVTCTSRNCGGACCGNVCMRSCAACNGEALFCPYTTLIVNSNGYCTASCDQCDAGGQMLSCAMAGSCTAATGSCP